MANKPVEPVLATIIEQSIPAGAFAWLKQKAGEVRNTASVQTLNTTFVLLPRKTGHHAVTITAEQQAAVQLHVPGSRPESWAADRLARVWLLMHLPAGDKASYIATIETLFKSAEMNELVALYSALPYLEYPEDWINRCAEGIRSNIGDVLEAIMYHNAYPAKYLPQNAWNQLVLKAFFTDKNINKIVGIDERANKELAETLLDYASERRSAHRTINPQLWRLVAPFITEDMLSLFEHLLESDDTEERNAALLACYYSPLTAARHLTNEHAGLQKAIETGQLNWHHLSFTI